jgi:hypothetical protein
VRDRAILKVAMRCNAIGGREKEHMTVESEAEGWMGISSDNCGIAGET